MFIIQIDFTSNFRKQFGLKFNVNVKNTFTQVYTTLNENHFIKSTSSATIH